jgi:S1-C subfamily serine protease
VPPTFEPIELPAEITPALLDASAVGAAVIPSVVTVQVGESDANGNLVLRGSGSGIIYDGQGHVVTNSHVVAAGTAYEVVLADLRVYPAELIGTDPTTDLAVLAITAQNIEPIILGDSDSLTVGAPAVAIGSPLGLAGGPSLTVGVISAFGREVRTSNTTTLYGMLQTDAPITQGSSGGALVDENGHLVGITTAVGVSDVGIEGIGFATPIEVVTRVADEIIAEGRASSPYLGISGATSFAQTTDGGTAPIGVFVNQVEPNTAASIAGLSEGDVIAAINGDTVKTMDELIALLRRYGAGAHITVTLDGGTIVTVTLGQRPDA